MAIRFKDRVFGGSMDAATKTKLLTRQAVHSGEVAPGDLVARNILNIENITSGYEASGRTTFARLYTIIEAIPLLDDNVKQRLVTTATNEDDTINQSLLNCSTDLISFGFG